MTRIPSDEPDLYTRLARAAKPNHPVTGVGGPLHQPSLPAKRKRTAKPLSQAKVNGGRTPRLTHRLLAQAKKIPHAPKQKVMLKNALAIMAMRMNGMKNSEIATALGLAESSLQQYLYYAGKKGWLDLPDPKDRLEYGVAHKVVRNLDEMLDSPNQEIRQEVTLKTAAGTIFKKFDQANVAPAPNMNVLSIKVELPPTGNLPTVSAADVGGTPRYLTGDVSESEI